MSYFFHAGAEAEYLETIAFYESRQLGLGAEYLAEFELILTTVVQAPRRYRIERKPNIRCVSFKRFPFKVLFRDVDEISKSLPSRIKDAGQIIGWIGYDELCCKQY